MLYELYRLCVMLYFISHGTLDRLTAYSMLYYLVYIVYIG